MRYEIWRVYPSKSPTYVQVRQTLNGAKAFCLEYMGYGVRFRENGKGKWKVFRVRKDAVEVNIAEIREVG